MTKNGIVLTFPRHRAPAVLRRDLAGTSLLFGRLVELLCRSLNWLQVVPVVRDVSILAPFSRNLVNVHVGAMFTCISVNGKDHFFRRN